jgi:hypothetical protein
VKFQTTILLALVVLAAGCMETQQQNTESTTSSSAQVVITSSTTLKKGPTTTLAPREPEFEPTGTTIKQALNATTCYELTNTTERDQCLSDAAGRDRDIGVCDNITEDSTRFKCRARLEDKPEHCDNIASQRQKNQCYWMMAFRWKKIAYCGSILMNPELSDQCVLQYIKSIGDPPGGPGKYAGDCFSMSTQPTRDQCIYFYIDVYNKTGGYGINPNLCTRIQNETYQMQCNQTYLKN